MARIIACDGCGKQSPDENNLHIANKWHELTHQPREKRNFYTNTRRKIILCEECFESTGIDEFNWEYDSR